MARIVRQGTIKIGEAKPEELIIKNFGEASSTFSIQVDNGSVSLKAKHRNNYDTEEIYPLAMIDMSNFNTVKTATNGLFMTVLDGIDEIDMEVSGAGEINWQELGD